MNLVFPLLSFFVYHTPDFCSVVENKASVSFSC